MERRETAESAVHQEKAQPDSKCCRAVLHVRVIRGFGHRPYCDSRYSSKKKSAMITFSQMKIVW